ncbi:MAG: hypothetical protein ACPLKS_04770 [Caldisericum exile]|uniref:hypothetical protein n=1 Tax=Caldisericum exile TaxID=693075 RepID=UPI003C715329
MFWVDKLLIELITEKLYGEVDDFIIDNLINDWEQYAKFIYGCNDLRQYQEIMNYIYDNTPQSSIEAFFSAWVNMWLKHYRKRVRITFKEELYNAQHRQVTELIRRGEAKIDCQQIIEMMEPLMLSLVKNGEIVCTRIIAKQILLQELGERKQDVIGLKDKIEVLNECMRKIKLISHIDGPLLFIKAKDVVGGNI